MTTGNWGEGCRAIGTKAVDTSFLWKIVVVVDYYQRQMRLKHTLGVDMGEFQAMFSTLDNYQRWWSIPRAGRRITLLVCMGSGRTKKITKWSNRVKWHASIFTHQRKHSNGLWWCLWLVLAEAEGTKNSARSHYNQLEAKSLRWRRDAAEAEGTKHSARSHFSRWEEKILWWTRMFRGHKRQASTRGADCVCAWRPLGTARGHYRHARDEKRKKVLEKEAVSAWPTKKLL
jgi:hypothetical protein